jgi:hypothetical protein
LNRSNPEKYQSTLNGATYRINPETKNIILFCVSCGIQKIVNTYTMLIITVVTIEIEYISDTNSERSSFDSRIFDTSLTPYTGIPRRANNAKYPEYVFAKLYNPTPVGSSILDIYGAVINGNTTLDTFNNILYRKLRLIDTIYINDFYNLHL